MLLSNLIGLLQILYFPQIDPIGVMDRNEPVLRAATVRSFPLRHLTFRVRLVNALKPSSTVIVVFSLTPASTFSILSPKPGPCRRLASKPPPRGCNIGSALQAASHC